MELDKGFPVFILVCVLAAAFFIGAMFEHETWRRDCGKGRAIYIDNIEYRCVEQARESDARPYAKKHQP